MRQHRAAHGEVRSTAHGRPLHTRTVRLSDLAWPSLLLFGRHGWWLLATIVCVSSCLQRPVRAEVRLQAVRATDADARVRGAVAVQLVSR
jgi:hypothetical protein